MKNKMVINIINEGDSTYSVEYVENYKMIFYAKRLTRKFSESVFLFHFYNTSFATVDYNSALILIIAFKFAGI